MEIRDALDTLLAGRDLDRAEARALIETLMSGDATPAQIGGVLVALRAKGETVDEITGAAEAMRELATRVDVDAPHLVDTCGTGGSGSNKLFNVSTAAAFVTAAAGAHVAKHGNRGMSSASGSADVLEAAGVNLDLTPEQVARCIAEVGVGFLFAQRHHGAMKHVGPARRELGVRTLFNVLGPLTNPAGAPNQVLGVFDRRWQRPLAEVLQALGSRHVLVVHADGLDEISLVAPTHIVELRKGAITEYDIEPAQFGIESSSHDGLRADTPAASLALVQAALAGKGPAADIVALNAGAAIYASGVALSLADGVTMAQDAIAARLARERLDELVRISSLMGED